MSRFLVLVTALVLALLIVGCKVAAETYTDPGRTITVGRGEQFLIALGSNPTTGYGWQAGYDENMLKLVAKTYEPSDKPKGVLGTGGIEFFRFQALKPGETRVDIVYKRPWEEQSIAQKSFLVIIK